MRWISKPGLEGARTKWSSRERAVILGPLAAVLILLSATGLSIWRRKNGPLRLECDSTRLTEFTYSPDSKYLAAIGYSPTIMGGSCVYLWEVSTGKFIHSWEGFSQVFTAVFSPHSKGLACSSRAGLWILDCQTGARRQLPTNRPLTVNSWQDDGSLRCSCVLFKKKSRSNFKTFETALDFRTGVVLYTRLAPDRQLKPIQADSPGGLYRAVRAQVTYPQTSRFGQDPAVGGLLTVIRLKDRKVLHISPAKTMDSLWWSDDRTLRGAASLQVGSSTPDYTAYTYDVATNKEQYKFFNFERLSLAYTSPDHHWLAARQSGQFKIYDFESGQVVLTCKTNPPGDLPRFAPDSKSVAFLDGSAIEIHRLPEG